jgi:hypothetical protein
MPWYSAQGSLDTLKVGRRVGRMHIVCYLRQESNIFETYWTTSRGVEVMDNSYRLPSLTVASPEGRVLGPPGRREALNRTGHDRYRAGKRALETETES